MTARPRLLDLFCGAGGAAVGYHRAGFEIVGVDLEPQPHYPFEFHELDAMDVLYGLSKSAEWKRPAWMLFDAIHASPPCHDHANISGRNRKAAGPKGTGWMLSATIDLLGRLSLPWVVENVQTARMAPHVYRARLCGSSFGLDVRRHRWFASNQALMVPPCAHYLQTPRFRSLDSRQATLAAVVGVHGHLNYAGEAELRRSAMGIDWMTNDELSQAIPPAYTEFIGAQLLQAIERAA
jgi:DNA (cytosine-5)-methyltransferase 1